MKIVGWEEMPGMLEGTIDQVYEPHVLGRPMVFGGYRVGTMNLTAASLLPEAMMADCFPPRERSRLGLDEADFIIMMPSGHGEEDFSYKPLIDYRFLVWEKADRRLSSWMLMDPAAFAEEMNSDNGYILVADEKVSA